MFYAEADLYIYNNPVNIDDGGSLFLPVEVDTEYTHPEYDLNNPSDVICNNLTVQVKSVTKKEGLIYTHPEMIGEPRHKTYRHGFVVCDYLEDLGYKVELTRLPNVKTETELPYLQVDLYAYFAVAELMRIFQGVYNSDISQLCHQKNGVTGIEQGRRLRAFTKEGNKLLPYVVMPWVIKIDDSEFRVRLSFLDTCGVGAYSYKDLCTNSGVILPYKDLFDLADKRQMDIMYNKRPVDFDNYALGDLYNYDALLGNAENFKRIYQSLGLEDFYSPPRLTIGATVSRLVESSITSIVLSQADDISEFIEKQHGVINAFCRFGTADYLKRKTTTTGCLNAKVDGGRCRNNRPTDTVAKGVLCDIDISGCYGEGLRVQTYPLGRPVLIDYPINSELNEYQSLRQFLKTYGKELVSGLWQARVSQRHDIQLTYDQDYLASWFPPKDMSKMVTDSAFAETDLWWTVDNVGEIKILNNEIRHAVITHDFIQWLENVASIRQRKELLDSLIVETALFYPASERVDSISELVSATKSHKGKNRTYANKSKGKTQKVAIEQECHKWYGINLGEMLIDQLLIERKKHFKKTPFNELYKLCINTVYGDMVSPFFTVGNVVVGNNITARARALAWCMEKGLNGWQSITDGCTFDVNRVLYPNREDRRITGELAVNLYANTNFDHHTFKPMSTMDNLSVTLNCRPIELTVVDGKPKLVIQMVDMRVQLDSKGSLEWVNKMAMEHLQQLFPNLDILHQKTTDVFGNYRIGQFEFEAKGLFQSGVFHGSANYSLTFNGESIYKMRSYSKKAHKMYEAVEDMLIPLSKDTKPSVLFLDSLRTPHSVKRSKSFIRERILKVGDYRRNYNSWKDTNVYPGCTVESVSIIHEFSLSQFTFQTKKQYDSWQREQQRLLNKYGQSYEMYFINDDGTLDYQLMIETVDAAIREGKMSLYDGLDKRQVNFYRQYEKHAENDCLMLMRKKLSERYYSSTEVLSDDALYDDLEDE